MASSANPHSASENIKDSEYLLHTTNTIVSNFVSVKLSGHGNYDLWKTQMLCLLDVYDMGGLVDISRFFSNEHELLKKKYSSFLSIENYDFLENEYDILYQKYGSFQKEHNICNSEVENFILTKFYILEKKYSSLLRGWIFGTLSEDVLRMVFDLDYASHVWSRLQSNFDSSTKYEARSVYPTPRQGEEIIPLERQDKAKKLLKAIVDGTWEEVYFELISDKDVVTEKINSDGDTILHLAVERGRNDIIRTLLWHRHLDLTSIKNSRGSTLLHVAATVGNTYAAKLLVKENKNLLLIPDYNGYTPLDRAYGYTSLDTLGYLLEAIEAHKQSFKESVAVDDYIGFNVLSTAISTKNYDFALMLLNGNPQTVINGDYLLMVLAGNFPSGLDYGEKFIYPSLENKCETILKRTKRLLHILVIISSSLNELLWRILSCQNKFQVVLSQLFLFFLVPLALVYWMYLFTLFILSMVCFPLFILYFLLWKAASTIVSPIKNIEQKKKEFEQAIKVLRLICKTIQENHPNTSRDIYTTAILEAACQDAYEVVDEILWRWPEAILCMDKSGHDIIQLAIIHRSEKTYNLLRIIATNDIHHRSKCDFHLNTMLHLVGRLAPSNKLKRITGAALQLQSELQWREEVEKFVNAPRTTAHNIYMETPDMVFTREHDNLVKEGESWFKAVAESCSITAALITTVVFAAAITVPGGSNQETGVPLFYGDYAFSVFAIADTISLFSSATSLLVFLSILTARFAEQDYLVRLPRRLLIGLCTLLLSVTFMMVAFSATLFLVFSRKRLWMLAPICGFGFLPIAFFLILQLPLVVDLFKSTYISKFSKSNHKNPKYNVKDILFYLGQAELGHPAKILKVVKEGEIDG